MTSAAVVGNQNDFGSARASLGRCNLAVYSNRNSYLTTADVVQYPGQ